MEGSQGNSKIFSVRIVSIDYYMAPPIPDVDIAYSSFQGGSVKEVPVIRVYGSTPAGQKACVHVHRALPYLYIPCSDIPLQSDLAGKAYENTICVAIEKALKLKGSAGSKRQHVHGCNVVRAKKFYGYHSSEELFVKIYLYYPQDISRLANLLLGGTVFEKNVQPYESHIPFLLQFKVDYNLYGMGHMHLVKMKFRYPVPDDVLSSTDHISPEAAGSRSSDSQADAIIGSCSSSQVWSASTIPDDWMWLFSFDPSGPSNNVTNRLKRQSTCVLEGDTTVDDVLNQQSKIYTSLSQLQSDVRMVHSLIPIWEEEFERSGVHETEMLTDPGKPSPENILRILSDGIDYQHNLMKLHSKAPSAFLPMFDEGARHKVPAQCLMEEGNLVGIGSQNSDERVRSSEAINMSILSQNCGHGDAIALSAEREKQASIYTHQVTEGLNLKAADPEEVALLKWLASSQAAEEINSDDELRRDIILNPLLPVASIDRVLEKANTDYETESQQECRDILDSMEDELISDNEKQALSAEVIPQLDGAGDHEQLPPPNSADVVMGKELVLSKCHTLPLHTSSSDNKRKRQKSQWGSLPLSPLQKINEDINSGSCCVNVSNECSCLAKNDAMVQSFTRCEANNCSDPSSRITDIAGCSSIDSRTLLSCSVRDLMRKKRCCRIESFEQKRTGGFEEDSGKENSIFLPKKLRFHMEESEEQNVLPFEASASSYVHVGEESELCEDVRCSPPLPSGRAGKRDFTSLPATFKFKDLDFGVFTSRSWASSVDKTCIKVNVDDNFFFDGHLRQSVPCSNYFSEKGDICPEGDLLGQPKRPGTVEQDASTSSELKSGSGPMKEKGSSSYVTMTFHKKPPIANWKKGTSEDLILSPLDSKRLSVEDVSESDDENLADKSGALENVLPYFTEKSYCSDGFYQESSLGIPTHYQNDGSFAFLLTPAISPPSADSVLKWLALNDRAHVSRVPLSESSLGCPLEPSDKKQCHGNHRIVIIEGGTVNYELERCQGGSTTVKAKEDMKVSVDVSQISGPSRPSNLTPLSQIGFRDPASVGAGQQLTLLSVEVQAESRGDLRPDPQHDAINIIVLAIQNDNSSFVAIHVLLRSGIETCGRNFDGISGGKLLVSSEERDLLDQFISIIQSVDPDILMGWDVQGSSLGYLAERAAYLGVSLLNKISRTASETKTAKRKADPAEKGSKDAVSSDSLISETKTAKRKADPAEKGSKDAVSSDSLISDTVIHDDTVIEDEWGRTHASGVHVGGRIVLNVWRLMRSDVKLNMYTLEAVAEAVLRRKVPSIPWKILNKWFSSGPERARFRCIDYMVERAKLNLEILDQLDMVNRTSELARIFGIDFFSVLSRGSQYRVESMLIRLAHTQNYVLISPGYQQVASQPAMECLPLVMEPESGFYSDPVIVLDFQSLYPSMIIAYNLCFSTCLGNVVPSKADTLGVSSYSPNVRVLKDLNQQILVTPNGVMYVPSKVRKGVLPRLLEEILSTRIMLKKAMKKLDPSQKILHRIFNARQLALKLIANVTYGYTAAGFSGRMPCAELADSIVQCGRRTLEHAISVVNLHEQWNARVIYGDTDSMFVLVKGRTLREAFQIGNEIASTITALNPNPVTLKLEKVYQSCFLLTKKRYVGYSYESLDQPKPIFDAKGIETVRRDTCGAVAKILEKSLRIFFELQDVSKLRAYLERQWSRILSGRVSLQDFVFAKEVRLGTYSMRSSSLPPAAIVASKAMRADPRAEPRYAERVPYVVVHGEPGARLIDMVVDPHELLAIDSPYRLNDLYYITKQIIPALQRVFGLVGADLSQWFQEMPRPGRDAPTKHHFNAVNSVRARIDYYYSSRHCVLCGEHVRVSNHLCDKCSKKGPTSAAAMSGITSRLERDIQHLVAICRHCGGGDWLVESGVKCTSLACPIYYERRKVQKELRAYSSIASDAGFYPKCMVEWF